MNTKRPRNAHWLTTVALLAAAFAFAGCTKAETGQITLRAGTSFGMCGGYCVQEWTFTKDETTLVRESNNDSEKFPKQTVTVPTPPEIWNSIAAAADMAALQKLEERIGCPDCADGGAEWVELSTGTTSKKVTFEYGRYVPEIQALIAAARAGKEALKNKVPK